MQVSLNEASARKVEGNEHFRLGRWDEAISAYRSGLSHLPERAVKKEHTRIDRRLSSGETTHEEEENEYPDPISEPVDIGTIDNDTLQLVELDEYAKMRAVLNANIGACYIKLVTACDSLASLVHC